jgi:hypothetical protein
VARQCDATSCLSKSIKMVRILFWSKIKEGIPLPS